MRVEFRSFGTHRHVDIAYLIPALSNESHRVAQQYLAVDILIGDRRIGKMETDVAHRRGAEQGIAKGMYQHIGVGVTQQPEGVVDAYAAQPQFTAFDQAVHVKAHSYAYFHFLVLFLAATATDKVFDTVHVK